MLGTATTNIDVLIIPALGKDKLLLDNCTMQALHAILDWDNDT